METNRMSEYDLRVAIDAVKHHRDNVAILEIEAHAEPFRDEMKRRYIAMGRVLKYLRAELSQARADKAYAEYAYALSTDTDGWTFPATAPGGTDSEE